MFNELGQIKPVSGFTYRCIFCGTHFTEYSFEKLESKLLEHLSDWHRFLSHVADYYVKSIEKNSKPQSASTT